MAWGTLGSTESLEGASGRQWNLRFERRLAPRPGAAENPASSVWLVRDTSSLVLHAAKRQNVSREEVDILVDEAAAWRSSSLSGPVLVELVDVFVIRDPPCSVTFLYEYCSRGHLPKRPPLSEPVLLTIAADMAAAASAVARATSGQAHGNITYSSMLVDGEGRARLAGFGAQRSAIVRDNPDLSPRDDIMDIGVLMYELMFGKMPQNMQFPADTSPYTPRILDVVAAMLEPPESRPDPEGIIAMARDSGAELRAPVVDIAADAVEEKEGVPSRDTPAIERSVEKLTTGVDAGGAYSTILSALERDPAGTARSVFAVLFKCPIGKDPQCAMRTLTMLHNMMLDGPDALMDRMRRNDKFLDWTESSWTRESIENANDPHPATASFSGGELAFYTSLLRRKATFHKLTAGGFSGGWERTSSVGQDGRDVLTTSRRKVVGGMAEMAEMASELGIRFAESNDEETALKHATLRPLVDECARACNAAIGLAGETVSIRDTEKLLPGVGRLWVSCKRLLDAVRDIRSAGGQDWAEQFAADAPPDIVGEADFRLQGGNPSEVADDMPDAGWEETEKMIATEAPEEEQEEAEKPKKPKKKKKKKKEEAAEEDGENDQANSKKDEQGEIQASDGAMVVHGSGDAASAAVTTMFGDLLKLDNADLGNGSEEPQEPLNGRRPTDLSDGEALASAFGAPPSAVVGRYAALPPPPGYDEEDEEGGGYDEYRARQEEEEMIRQQERAAASTGAWAARAGYGGGALVVHHSAQQAPNKPHPAFCQCALCQQAEAQDAAASAAYREREGYSDNDGYDAPDAAPGPDQYPAESRGQEYADEYGANTHYGDHNNGYGGHNAPEQRARGSYYDNDADSYESVDYSVDDQEAYDPAKTRRRPQGSPYDAPSSAGDAPSTRNAQQTSAPAPAAGAFVLPTQLVVNMKKLRTGDKIGEGAFGVVYKGEYKRETVAIKKMSKAMMASKNAMDEFRNEVSVMCSLSHPNVLKCIAAGLTKPNVLLATEFMKRGNLFDVLYKARIRLTWAMIRKIALQLAAGMQHLEENSIVHRDLKASNVLLDGSYNVKLGDFGLAGPERPPSPHGVSGTYQYMAPEILTGAPHTVKSDVYAYGLVLCEMISGSPPFFGLEPMEAAQRVMNENARPPIPPHCQRPYANLIQSCWGAAPSIRPSFAQIIKQIETTTR